ncbi:hypothetical protein ACFVT5_14570 [Streptomyces sp. NPDC058001]|uniref:hypothetical protein n=1 Tax=Streptomyces sp. NPDC058001 TaxID=3346300 RepID=UPI0036E09022
MLERITERRAELDELEEQLTQQLAEVRAERALERVSDQLANEHASTGQVGGQAIMLIPHRAPGVEEVTLPPDYQRVRTHGYVLPGHGGGEEPGVVSGGVDPGDREHALQGVDGGGGRTARCHTVLGRVSKVDLEREMILIRGRCVFRVLGRAGRAPDKLAVRYEVTVLVAAINEWL